MSQSVVALWSGGLDSTAVVAACLANGYDVTALSLVFNETNMEKREATARERLIMPLRSVAYDNGTTFHHVTEDAQWLWHFSPDHKEIPRRNRHMIDYAIMHYHARNVALGEYIGADTWVIRDHVGAADADARALTSYVYHEYGIDYRLLTLADFGESRYKSDRLRIGFDYLGPPIMYMTNCMCNTLGMCGDCYKCVERAAACDVADMRDKDNGLYLKNPREHPAYAIYCAQMNGEDVTMTYEAFNTLQRTHESVTT